MKVYRHAPKGTRFYVLILFSLVLLGLNVIILPGQEALPVKLFTFLFTAVWLVVTIDSLAARVVLDEEGIGLLSMMCKRFVRWSEITEVSFGHRWVLGTFMPEHITICSKTGTGKTAAPITLHNDLKNWNELLGEIVRHAPSKAVSRDLKTRV